MAVPSAARSGWGGTGHRRAVVAGTLVVLLVLGGGAAAWAATAAGSSGYRMARVTRADIQQTMTIVGNVQPVSDASASFQVAGKVATVAATVGEQVTAGQSLGTLDATALSEAVSSAQSTLNADEAKLVQDENSQSSSASNSPSPSAPASTTTTVPASHGGSPGAGQSAITQAQNTLTQDEAKTVADQQQEAADLTQAQHVCGAGATTGTTSTTTTTTTPANCEAALGQVSKDQQQVSSDQATVAKDEAALSQALGQGTPGAGQGTPGTGQGTPGASGGSPAQSPKADAAATPSGTGNTGNGNPNSNPTGNGSSPSNAAGNGSGSGNGNGSGSGASSDTPQQIAADQAAIDSAQADLTVAQQSLTEANLTSPISGTVVSVGINVGDTVSAGSGTSVIVIIGTHSYEVVGTLSSSQVPSVKTGDSARVQVDGLSGTIVGTVSQVGPVQSGQSGYSFPLVVALPTSTSGLYSGSSANVVVATGGLSNVVAVPTSAVQTLGSRSYVEVLSNGTVIRKLIKVGMVGDTYTQVLSGLAVGQSVVLADYAAPVPSSNTNTLGGFGGFGGGSFGNGGGAFQFKGAPGPGGAVSVRG